jgi:hypothetical protein
VAERSGHAVGERAGLAVEVAIQLVDPGLDRAGVDLMRR